MVPAPSFAVPLFLFRFAVRSFVLAELSGRVLVDGDDCRLCLRGDESLYMERTGKWREVCEDMLWGMFGMALRRGLRYGSQTW